MQSERKEKRILWFEELGKEDIPLVGGKNANLGEMLRAKINVPPGYAIAAHAYHEFITKTGIAEKIYKAIEKTVTDVNDPKQYEEASKRIRRLIESTSMPSEIAEEITAAYSELGERIGMKDVFVAVRSSATAEDLPDASFAGQQETFLNVKGTDDLIDKTIKCWSSLFTPRAIYYRNQKYFSQEQVLISVGVQKMVNAKAAGVIFTLNPVTGESNQIVIEANWGLGESVVSGSVTPDFYMLDKITLKIIEKRIAKKTVEYIRDLKTGKTIHGKVPAARQEQPCLNEEEVIRLTEIARSIEQHYGRAQDIEFSIERDLPFPENVFIVQARPETVWSSAKVEATTEGVKSTVPLAVSPERKVVVKGLAAGRRDIGMGVAKVALTAHEAAKIVQKGDILVTIMTNPDYVPFMKIAGAIVTDKGGVTAHASIVSRELGIPCIVGTETATKVMITGREYTVDAKNGVVYEGRIGAPEAKSAQKGSYSAPLTAIPSEPAPVTATKIYMNLGVPDKIEEYKHLPFDGIGLMRLEFILASYIGQHPLY
ncbi:phosphoenolpyruvate synthase, partial [Candidatus Bathyarchaeota archaeon]|nr:phosphoenolpyruvate synthase [Candidatus Bathyarchaeota archaeon]